MYLYFTSLTRHIEFVYLNSTDFFILRIAEPRTLATGSKATTGSMDLEMRVKLEDLYSCATICKKVDRTRFDANSKA